ncbi:argininosuccinate lyase [Bacillus songklensis]|uniref:Argininosuccinate lyase n=1 Tax=Bacillus songklensis TaxID=1069116 RepID=A0ABV8AYG0_9BACI
MMSSKEEFIQREGMVFPGKTYVEHLLKHVFNDQRDYLFHEMLEIHKAHIVMLAEQNILQRKEAKVMLQGVEQVSHIDYKNLNYDPRFEDLFFLVEHRMGEEIGKELAGKMHIARSRNDMGVAMYRMVLRRHILETITNTVMLSDAILEKAEEHKETIMTAYTHTQPAQPTTFGHYLVAVFDLLNRDIDRLWAAYRRVNVSPLGSAALTTTGFPISRQRVCELLGFGGIIENSYDAVAGGDYLIEAASAVLSLMTNMGRWIQDFLLQVTKEFGAIQVADPYVQISSIMPQKRNPVSIEHSRALASSSSGEALAAVQMIHNTPFSDIVDTEDDLQPHLYRSYEKANRVIHLMNAVIKTMTVNKALLRKRAKTSCITITELADVLARDKDVPFRAAHKMAGLIAKQCVNLQKELYELKVNEVNSLLSSVLPVSLTAKEWEGVVCPETFVQRRRIQGGPSYQEVQRMISLRKQTREQQASLVQREMDFQSDSKEKLRKAMEAIFTA